MRTRVGLRRKPLARRARLEAYGTPNAPSRERPASSAGHTTHFVFPIEAVSLLNPPSISRRFSPQAMREHDRRRDRSNPPFAVMGGAIVAPRSPVASLRATILGGTPGERRGVTRRVLIIAPSRRAVGFLGVGRNHGQPVHWRTS